jgi:glucose-1-phosphate adenylyltransferase
MTVGMYLPDKNHRLPDGNPIRTVSAIHFASRYRLIDFTLSNLVNAGIQRIGVMLGSNYQTLLDHMGSGRDWDLSRKTGGFSFFSSYHSDVQGESAVERSMRQLDNSNADTVVLCDGSVFYNMDYRKAIAEHKLNYSLVTSVVTERDGAEVPLNTFIMKRTVALALLARIGDNAKEGIDVNSVLEEIFPVRRYKFSGYSGKIDDIYTFYKYNMDMLNPVNRNSLFHGEGGRVYTTSHDSQPTQYGPNASVRNSIIADGCYIDGTVENSVIFRYVRVEKGASVRGSILQNGTSVTPGADVRLTVTDKNVVVTQNRKISGTPATFRHGIQPAFVASGKII